jgi:hypothetical protein
MSDNFRIHFRENYISKSYNGNLHLLFTISWCLGFALLSIYFLDFENFKRIELLTIPITFFYANMLEYFGHKGPLHHKKKGLGLVYQRHTLQHHRFFMNNQMQCDSKNDYKIILFPPVLLMFFLCCFALPTGIIIYFIATKNCALLFVSTALLYFLNYELLHLSYHLPKDHFIHKIPLFKFLSSLHTIHHHAEYMQTNNFNITYPIFDKICGTYKKI